MLAPVFRDVADAAARSPARAKDPDRLAAQQDLAGIGGRQAEDGLRQFRVGPSRPGRRIPGSRRCRTRRKCRSSPAARLRIFRSSSATSPRGTSRFGNTADDLAADHQFG